MESSLILQEKSFDIRKTKLDIDFCQIILKFGSVCFIIRQLNEYSSKLKHNYSSFKDNLNELVRLGLLTELKSGARSGKNYSDLYIKSFPATLSSKSIEDFSSKYLKEIKISWSTYILSCQTVILSSKSSVLSPEASNLLNNDVYRCIVQQQQQQPTTAFTSTNKIKGIKNCTKKSKTNSKIRKIETNQNSILKYFHPIISTTSDSSRRTDRNFSNIFNDNDDSQTIDTSSSSSSSTHQSSDIIKSTTSNIIESKYFLQKNVQAPFPKNFN